MHQSQYRHQRPVSAFISNLISKMGIRYIISISLLCISSILLDASTSPKTQKNHTDAQKNTEIIRLSNNIVLEGFRDTIRKSPTIRMKKEVYNIIKAYYPQSISAIRWEENDAVFTVNGTEIMYEKGRMLIRKNLALKEQFHPIIYPYNRAPIIDMFDTISAPNPDLSTTYYRSSDFQIALAGGIPRNIANSRIQDFRILGFTVRLHTDIGKIAKKGSDEIMQLAKTDKSLANFLASIRTISGFRNRNVKGSSNVSMHAFGFAFDIIPYSYNHKVAYWKWAKVLYPDTWDKKTLDERWLIHQKVVSTFEKYGFIWGGKWPNYDTMHIEYRPEIVAGDISF